METGDLPVKVTRESFGALPDGTGIDAFTIRNAHCVAVKAITYGGVIVSLETPDRRGNPADIVLGCDDLQGYLKGTPYFGAIVGRYANRIADGRFSLDGETYTLATNLGPHHLHGGATGFDRVVWAAEPFERDDSAGVTLRYTSPAGEEGYPGTLAVAVTYTLTADDTLAIDYFATTDAATPINLTQHSYFNLAGEGNGDILDHDLTIFAGRYTAVDASLVPTGAMPAVDGTPFDFRTPHAIGERINDDQEHLRFGGGYDHNFVLDPGSGELRLSALVHERTTGRILGIHTTEPGLQFYSGNYLDPAVAGKAGNAYGPRSGFCLETQHFPDSPNRPEFPPTILRPGEEYRSRTLWRFATGD